MPLVNDTPPASTGRWGESPHATSISQDSDLTRTSGMSRVSLPEPLRKTARVLHALREQTMLCLRTSCDRQT